MEPCARGPAGGSAAGRVRRGAVWVGIGALFGLAVLEVALDRHQRAQVPTPQEWEAAARRVRAEHRPGDLIVVTPEWAEPLGRLVLGDRMPLSDLTRPDAAAYGTIFELSIRGRRHPDTRGARPLWRRRVGHVTVTRYRRTPVRVTADLFALLGRAAVTNEAGGRVLERCPWDARRQRFRCRTRWQDVRPVYAEIGYRPRRCVLAHPADGVRRVIAYPPLPLGARLVVYTGLKGYDPRYRARRAVWEFARFRAGRFHPKRPPRPIASAPVRLAVQVGGRTLARLEHPIEDEGWRRHVVPLPAGLGRAPVRLVVSTRHAWSKPFCFYARSEADAAPGLLRATRRAAGGAGASPEGPPARRAAP